MNEPRKTSDLDRALRGWAERRQAAKDFEGLSKRIVAACGDPDAVAASPASAGAPRLRRIARSSAAWFAMGATAATLVAAMLYVAFQNPPGHVPSPDVPPQYAWLQESQLSQKAALLREMEPVFENRLQWVAETNGRVVLQVQQEDRSETSPPETTDVVIRVVVVQREPQATRWTPVWAVDVIARQEEMVHLTPANAGLPLGTELSLWAYAVDDDAIAVDSRLSLAKHSLEVDSSEVQRPRVPSRVHEVRMHGQQYRVFQTIAILNNKV